MVSDADHERLRARLQHASPESAIITYQQGTETAEAAAAAVGCETGQIVKSLLFIAGDRPVLVLAAGDRRLDTARLAPLLGLPRKRIRMAAPDEVVEWTGFAVGGVPPFGHRSQIETIVDEALARFELVYAAGGSGNAVFPIRYDTLIATTSGRVAEISTQARG